MAIRLSEDLTDVSRKSRMTLLADGKSKHRRAFLEQSQHSVIGAGGTVVDNRDSQQLKEREETLD